MSEKRDIFPAHQEPEPEHTPCGDTMTVKRLTAIRPDASEVVIFDSSCVRSHRQEEG